MGDFRKPSFGGKRGGFNKNNDKERTMYQAVCGTCAKDCEVPFEPTSGKPVLCSDCFKSSAPRKESRGGFNKFGSDRGGRKDFAPRRQSNEMSESAAFHIDKLKKQLDNLEEKIDMIMTTLHIPKTMSQATSQSIKELVSKATEETSEEE